MAQSNGISVDTVMVLRQRLDSASDMDLQLYLLQLVQENGGRRKTDLGFEGNQVGRGFGSE